MTIPVADREHASSSVELTLVDYLAIIRRRRWPIILVLGAVALATTAFTVLQNPEYRATASVLIRTQETASLFPLDGAVEVTRSIASERAFLNSDSFRDRAGKLSPQPSSVETSSDESNRDAAQRSVVAFEATASVASDAAEAANTWSTQYIQQRHEFEVAELEESIDAVLVSLEGLEQGRLDLLLPISAIDDALSRSTDPEETARLADERLTLLASLAPELDSVEGQISRLSTNVTGMQLTHNLVQSPEWLARVSEPASIPGSPFSPNIERNIALGVVSGLILSIGAALLLESLDVGLRSVDEVEAVTGLNHLASIPRLARRGATPGITEAYQRVVSALRLTRPIDGTDGCQVILVTSALPGEGKTTAATSVAKLFTKGRTRTLVIDADLHRPAAGQELGIANRIGLSDYLAGTRSVDEIIFESPDSIYLNVIPAGQVVSGEALDLLRSTRFEVLVEKLRGVYDQIIIDSPPLLAVIDPVEIALYVDCAVLVVRSGRLSSKQLSEAQIVLESASVEIIGTVLVAPSPGDANTYSYDYSPVAPRRLAN